MNDAERKAKVGKDESKPDGVKTDAYDILVANSIFPDPAAVFTGQAIPLAEAKKTASIILDTNALLVPYGIGAQTLSQIEDTYRQLLIEKRLFIPAQVAREFARNRVTKLAELHQKLSRRRSQVQSFQQGAYPLLEQLPEYQRLRDVEGKLDSLTSEYRKLTTAVLDHVRSWEWNDPVSVLYSKLFSAAAIVDTAKTAEEIKREHSRRFLHKIPPGYKDEGKADRGIGDLLIWLAILELGSTRKTSLLFVSGEEKTDWWHRSEDQPLYPRFELVDEYRRASEGRSFHIIKFSELLELFGASSEIVAEVRGEESANRNAAPLSEHTSISLRRIHAERAVVEWLVAEGYSLVPAARRSGVDFIVEGPMGSLAVDIIYSESPDTLLHRMRAKHQQHRDRRDRDAPLAGLQLAVVIVSDTPEALRVAERHWAKLDPPYRLCTGLLMPDGHFQVQKAL